jgi:hypothetical protein
METGHYPGIFFSSDSDEKDGNDLLENYRQAIEKVYRQLGFQVQVPKPSILYRDFKILSRENQALFYRPSTRLVPYEKFMKAIGYGDDWTVRVHSMFRINWYDTENGYWFITSRAKACPFPNDSWENCSKEIRLPYLEEYVIVWFFLFQIFQWRIDERTMTWLLSTCDDAPLYAGTQEINGPREKRFFLYILKYHPKTVARVCGGRKIEVLPQLL